MVDYNSQLELHRQELINEYSLKQAMGKMTDKELVSLMNCVPQEARPVIQKVREEKKKNWKTQKDDIYASLGIVDSNMSEGQVLATVQNMTAREWRQFSSTMYFSKSELAGLHSSLQTSQPQITEGEYKYCYKEPGNISIVVKLKTSIERYFSHIVFSSIFLLILPQNPRMT